MTFGLRDVTVRYGRRVALDRVHVHVEPARITALVGGDGAGKSTALAALVGLVAPSGGSVSRPPKREIGYVPATAGLYRDLTVDENLEFTARAFGMKPAERSARMDDLLEATGLLGARRRLAGQLSGGMQRKLAVALALVHAPALLVLDEPTTGVDPVSRADLWRLVSRAASVGTAVAVATTYVNEAARATSVVLLSEGRCLASGSPEEILRTIPGALGTIMADTRPTDLSWRRGAAWRVWAPDGVLPAGLEHTVADLHDAVVMAELDAARRA